MGSIKKTILRTGDLRRINCWVSRFDRDMKKRDQKTKRNQGEGRGVKERIRN